MFKKLKWGAYAPLMPSKDLDLETLQKLITLCFPTSKIDKDSLKAKELLKARVITIVDGQHSEVLSYDDLIYHKLPYVLFSNNFYFVRSYRRALLQAAKPIDCLKGMVVRYHHTIKNDKNFHL